MKVAQLNSHWINLRHTKHASCVTDCYDARESKKRGTGDKTHGLNCLVRDEERERSENWIIRDEESNKIENKCWA